MNSETHDMNQILLLFIRLLRWEKSNMKTDVKTKEIIKRNIEKEIRKG